MTVRDLAKSAITLPWAMSVFGAQQIANLFSPQGGDERTTGAAHAIDAVTDETARHLSGWLKQTYEVGTNVQRSMVDMMMLRAPEIDSGRLMRAVAEMQSAPGFKALVEYGMPRIGWLDSFLVSSEDAPAVAQEFSNKVRIILLVTQVHDQLG